MKNRILTTPLLMLLICLAGLFGCREKEKKQMLSVGDDSQGGRVAFIFRPGDKGYVEGETHGLIAAHYDHTSSVEWGCYSVSIAGAGGTEIGDGSPNTMAIADSCVTNEIAAKICKDMVSDGYNDWYLPSKTELYLLYLNRAAIGGFKSSGRYWSSSQFDDKGAWTQLFDNDQPSVYGKVSASRVRAVRSF